MFLTFFPVKCQFFILFDIILLLSKVSINLRLDKNTVLPLNVSLTIWTENMDYGLPGSSVPGILQARILAWVAISFSRRSSPPRGWTHVSCIAGRFFTDWATRETLLDIRESVCQFWRIWGRFPSSLILIIFLPNKLSP